MRFFFILVTFGIIAFMTSCSTVRQSAYVASLEKTPVYTDFLKADLDISEEKVEGTARSCYLFGFWRILGDNKYTETKGTVLDNTIFGSKLNKVKSAAMYKALKESDADMLITPKYDTKRRSYLLGLLRIYKVRVRGYKATIKNIHPIDTPLEMLVAPDLVKEKKILSWYI
ncbi:MAG: hypothetical protein GX905_08990 [Bacteroidales bacterium]|nr:hypothetical protein [Bacteroidales bacterium]